MTLVYLILKATPCRANAKPDEAAILGELRDVAGPEELECPVDHDADAFLPRREFEEIDRAPEPPRQETGHGELSAAEAMEHGRGELADGEALPDRRHAALEGEREIAERLLAR